MITANSTHKKIRSTPLLTACVATFCLTLQLTDAKANEQLATDKKCLSCHTISAKKIGPSFINVAKAYAHQIKADEKLSKKILEGSWGTWGWRPMPANKQVSEDEARQLAQWILSLKETEA